MKKMLRQGLGILLTGAILLSMLVAGVMGTALDDETTQTPTEQGSIEVELSPDETEIIPFPSGDSTVRVLYSWTASNLADDLKVFSSNLSDDSDERQRWNESAVMYTQQETEQMVLHTFLNNSGDGTYGLSEQEDAAGRTAVDSLKVDAYPMAETDGMAAVGLSLVYAHRPADAGMNPANSGLLRIYVSEDGQTWSEDYVSVRRAQILGSGTAADGGDLIYYRIDCENLMNIGSLASGDEIAVLRIMPDGVSGIAGGSFSLCALTLTGYGQTADFTAAVPAETGTAPAAADARAAVLTAYENSDQTGLDRVLDAISLVTRTAPAAASDMTDTVGLRLMDGISVKTAQSVNELFGWMTDRGLRAEDEIAQIRAEYEAITTTQKLLRDLNTPQQIFEAYAACQAGDLLLQLTDSASGVYMVKSCTVVRSGVSIDPNNSTLTYYDEDTETTATFFDLYASNCFAPIVVDALADDAVQPVRVDGHISVADGARVALSSGLDIEKIELSLDDFAATVTDPGAAVVYTGDELDAFVSELEPGTYTMTANVYTGLANETPVSLQLTFTVTEEETLFTLYGANITMGNTLDMNFYVAQSNFEGDGCYAVLTGPGGTKTVSMTGWAVNNAYYQFTYDGLSAKQMSEDITVTIYDAQGTQISEVWTDSMQSYIMRILDKQTEDTARTLLVDMLNYGTAAQENFVYRTDDPANGQLTEAHKAYATQTAAACTNSRTASGGYYGTNFDLENRISMNLYFSGVTGDMSARITFTDHMGTEQTVTVPGSEFGENNGYAVINVDEIVAADGRQPVTCTIYDTDGTTVVASVTDSLESYVARMSESYPWLLEIMKFSDSANAYLHRNDT